MKGCRLGLDEIPDDWFAWAVAFQLERLGDESGIEVIDWWDEFHDYWVSVSGQKGCKLDWFATWRNHVRKEVRREAEKRSRNRQFSVARDARAERHGIGSSAAARARRGITGPH
jgi:hypothetical protein